MQHDRSRPSPASASDAKQLFDQHLRDCYHSKHAVDAHRIGDLWHAYDQVSRWNSHSPDREEYVQLAEVLHKRAQQTRTSIHWRHITRVFEDAESLACAAPDLSILAISAYGRSGQLDRATAVYERLQANPHAAATAHEPYFEACLNHGVVGKAWQILKEMSDAQDTSRYLARFVDVCSKKSNLRQAMVAARTFQPTINDGSVADQLWRDYAKMMSLSVDITSAFSVEAFLATFTQHALSPKASPRQQDLFTATHLHTLMNYLTKTSNISPTALSCDILLDMYAHDNHFQYIKTVLELMQQHDLSPTTRTTSILIRIFGSGMPLPDTCALYGRLNEAGRIDSYLANAFIQVFGRSHAPKQAQSVARMAQESGLDIDLESHAMIIQAYRDRGQTDQAFAWLQGLDHELLAQTHGETAPLDLHAAVMEGWLGEARWAQCIDHYHAMAVGPLGGDVQKNSHMVKTVITAMLADARWTVCETLLASRPIDFNAATIYEIINTLLHLKRHGETGAHLVPSAHIVRALQALERSLGIFVSAGSAGKIIEALGERGHVRHAYRLYRWIQGKVGVGKTGKTPTVETSRCTNSYIYFAMMKAAVACNYAPIAERAWHDLGRRFRFKDDPVFSSQVRKQPAYNMILNAHAAQLPKPKLERVKWFFQEITDKYTPDRTTYNVIIKAFVNLGKTDTACQVFETMLESGIQPDKRTINTLLRGWVTQKDWTGVERFVNMLRSSSLAPSFDIVTFNILIQGFLHLDKPQTAYIHTLKMRGEWKRATAFEKDQPPYPLQSESIWEIFEMALGHQRSEIEGVSPPFSNAEHPKRTLAAVLLRNDNPIKGDTITYQLFTRAFRMAGDKKSALLLDDWRARHGHVV